MPGSDGTRAAIDCGTNSTRLLVVDGTGRALERLMRITRLGQGVDATRRLAPKAIGRTLEVLEAYAKTMVHHEVSAARLVATSAVRDAANGQEFLDRASAVAGVRAELLSGDAEGRLAYAGATADLPPSAGDDLVIDIGGGSTELVLAHHGQVKAVSLDLGCVRLSERYLQHDPPLPEELAAATAAIAAELDRAVSSLGHLRTLAKGSRLIGLAGTVSTLVTLELKLTEYDRALVHHAVLPAALVARWCEVLGAETASGRAARPGIEPGRADVIVGGVLVLREVMGRFGFAECLVSEADILDGLVASLRT